MKRKASITALQRRIMAEQEAARQEAWRKRRDGTEHISDRPKDRWVIRLLSRTTLSSDHIETAHKIAALIEAAVLRTASAMAERVGGSRADPHDRMRLAIQAAAEIRMLKAHLSTEIPEYVEIFNLAFGTPHLSAAEILRRTGRKGAWGYEFIGRAIAECLECAFLFWRSEKTRRAA